MSTSVVEDAQRLRDYNFIRVMILHVEKISRIRIESEAREDKNKTHADNRAKQEPIGNFGYFSDFGSRSIRLSKWILPYT